MLIKRVPAYMVNETLTDIWSVVLGCHVDANTNFVAAGGDSAAALRVMRQINDAFILALSNRLPLDIPQMSDFARHVVDAAAMHSTLPD